MTRQVTGQTYRDLARQLNKAGVNAQADGFCVVVYMDDIQAEQYARFLETPEKPGEKANRR